MLRRASPLPTAREALLKSKQCQIGQKIEQKALKSEKKIAMPEKWGILRMLRDIV